LQSRTSCYQAIGLAWDSRGSSHDEALQFHKRRWWNCRRHGDRLKLPVRRIRYRRNPGVTVSVHTGRMDPQPSATKLPIRHAQRAATGVVASGRTHRGCRREATVQHRIVTWSFPPKFCQQLWPVGSGFGRKTWVSRSVTASSPFGSPAKMVG
jgi:hypothetical protein